MIRCDWCGTDPDYIRYHDEDWGVPVHDDRKLFEMLILEGAQAGLSWITILKRRNHYRKAFDDFDMDAVAAYTDRDVQRLLADAGIIRNRLKVRSAITNARKCLDMRDQFGSLDAFFWRFTDHRAIQNCWNSVKDLPASTPLSQTMSRDLKRLGFSFVGPTICYSFMQSVGMVNDHIVSCFRHKEIREMIS